MVTLHAATEADFYGWINERHRIYLAREAGAPKPWSEDPIFQTYKFTNVFRQLDRGTVWLREHFLEPHRDDDPALIIFNVGWYRLFNWTGTGARLGWQTRWSPARVRTKLKKAEAAGEQVFTGAHIVWGEKGVPKIDGVLPGCTALWKQRGWVAKIAKHTRSLEATFEELVEIRGIGPFIGYEIVSDLRHTRVLGQAHDINTWANVGPGALRGLRRLYPEMAPREGLALMRTLLWMSGDQRAPHVPRLELRDIEHSLCEFDKYCRVKFGEGRPRATYPGRAEEAERGDTHREERARGAAARHRPVAPARRAAGEPERARAGGAVPGGD